MLFTKIRQAKITCRECDRLSLPYGIRKKIGGYETLTHRFTKRTAEQNENKKVDRTQTKRGDQKNKSQILTHGNNGRLFDTNEKLEPRSIINQTKLDKVTVKVLSMNSI